MDQNTFHSEHHRRLDVLAGAWQTTITALEPDGSAGAVSQASDIYTWMPNGHFLMHEVDAAMGSERVQSVEVIGINAASGGFFSRSYDPDGSTNDFVSRIDGLEYTISGEVQRFAGHFSDDGLRLTGEWMQLIGGNWMPFVRVVLERKV
ncbi:hypothetical protein [Stenotrophomonas sp. SY1]|uniref:hypothetical protein n=1 Tax=Stenotrophomonas sp. SY1 TaxID=477235 RepID=UPI001E3596F9|nr:hypothetical protein [Stenotrophomonas sp. SY1]MCD9086956.1 hypothetical protein [Stenotrophomonas sp. SY1]